MKVGPYELLELLGCGGMGAVHEARGPNGEVVAVKVLLPGANVARFRREQRLQGELGEKEGFVPLLDAGESPQGPFIVMPFLEGGTLRDRLRTGPLGVAATLHLGRALAAALARAHERGIVHRDLKPENVLFTGDGRPLVADLGLAKHFRDDVPGASRSVSMSQAGTLRGTIGYAAPEQLEDAKNVTPRADVFALGAILHECLSGNPAFSGDTPLEVFDAIRQGRVSELDRAAASSALAAVIGTALARDPERRFEDAGALLRALEGLSESKKRSPALLAGVLVVAGGLALGLARRRPSEPPPQPPPPPPSPSLHLRIERTFGDRNGKTAEIMRAVIFTPDGKGVLTAQGGDGEPGAGSFEESVILWDAANGAEVRRFEGHKKRVTGLAVVDSERFASSSWDGTVRIWKLSGTCAGTIEAGSRVHAIAATKRHTLFAATDRGVAGFDLETGQPTGVKTRKEAPALSVAVTPEGSRLMAGFASGEAFIWTFPDEREIAVIPREGPVLAVALSDDGFTAFAAGEVEPNGGRTKGTLRLVEPDSGRVLGPLGCVSPVKSVLLGSDRVFFGDHDGSLRVHAGTQESNLAQVPGSIEALALAPSGGRGVAVGSAGKLFFIDSQGREKDLSPKMTRVAFGRGVLLAGGYDGTVSALDPESGAFRWAKQAHAAAVFAAVVSPDGKLGLTGGLDQSVVLWDVGDGRELLRLDNLDFWIQLAGFARDGKTAFFANHGRGNIRALDVATHAVRELEGSGPISALVVHPDGKRLVAARFDGLLELVDLASGKITRSATRLGGMTFLACSADGSRVVTTFPEDTLTVWDTERLEKLREWKAGSTCYGVGFVDATHFVTGSYDGGISVWDAERGALVDRVSLRSETDWCVHVATDGREIYAATMRGVIVRLRAE